MQTNQSQTCEENCDSSVPWAPSALPLHFHPQRKESQAISQHARPQELFQSFKGRPSLVPIACFNSKAGLIEVHGCKTVSYCLLFQSVWWSRWRTRWRSLWNTCKMFLEHVLMGTAICLQAAAATLRCYIFCYSNVYTKIIVFNYIDFN